SDPAGGRRGGGRLEDLLARPSRAARLPLATLPLHWTLNKQRRQHESDRREQLDEDVQRRSRRVLERIPDRVADHRRLVRRRALSSVGAHLDVLLGVVPGSARVVQESGQKDSRNGPDNKGSRDGLRSDAELLEDEPD